MTGRAEHDTLMAAQDACLIAITDGAATLPSDRLVELPPWRAVLVARVAARAGVGLAGGTLRELVEMASAVGGEGRLTWPPQHAVLHWAEDVPDDVREASPGIDGRWIDTARVPAGRPWSGPGVRTAHAEPVEPPRFEVRDDGVAARVWEVRLGAPVRSA